MGSEIGLNMKRLSRSKSDSKKVAIDRRVVPALPALQPPPSLWGPGCPGLQFLSPPLVLPPVT